MDVRPDDLFAGLGHIHHHGDEFSIGLDLVDVWGESNPEAEDALRVALAEHDPALAERLRYDTESSAVWILADAREDLEAVKRYAYTRA